MPLEKKISCVRNGPAWLPFQQDSTWPEREGGWQSTCPLIAEHQYFVYTSSCYLICWQHWPCMQRHFQGRQDIFSPVQAHLLQVSNQHFHYRGLLQATCARESRSHSSKQNSLEVQGKSRGQCINCSRTSKHSRDNWWGGILKKTPTTKNIPDLSLCDYLEAKTCPLIPVILRMAVNVWWIKCTPMVYCYCMPLLLIF